MIEYLKYNIFYNLTHLIDTHMQHAVGLLKKASRYAFQR